VAEGAKFFRVGDEVAAALEGHRRVVAFESTIFSGLGLPSPANRECFDRCVTAVRDGVFGDPDRPCMGVRSGSTRSVRC